MNFLTDFADQAVTLPVAAVVLLLLLAAGWWRGALAWGGGVGGVLAVMLVLKLVMFTCAWRLGGFATPSPSGHTATAAVVYGGLAALAVRGRAAGVLAALVLAAGAAALVGFTRVELGVHNLRDVVTGAAVGVAGAGLMRLLAGVRPARLPTPLLAGAALLVMVLLHGQRLQAEPRLRSWASDLWPLTLCQR